MTLSIGAAVLASGLSRRFGEGDKLMHPFHGAPLCSHVGRTLAALSFARHVAVCPGDDRERTAIFSALGFTIIRNPDPDAGMGASLACAARDAQAHGLDGLLVCLADMPCVTAPHLTRLLARFSEADAPRAVASQAEGRAVKMPPALFRASTFETLAGLTGDRARALFSSTRR